MMLPGMTLIHYRENHEDDDGDEPVCILGVAIPLEGPNSDLWTYIWADGEVTQVPTPPDFQCHPAEDCEYVT